MTGYKFTNNWFDSTARGPWEQLFTKIRPAKVIEVGSYEGASACYLIEKLGANAPLEIHCVDTWSGGVEHQSAGVDMASVETRFRENTALAISRVSNPVALHIHKGASSDQLVKLLAGGHRGSFDFVYVDGSHQAADVLADAVLAFMLAKPGAMLVFDDYLWAENLPYGRDPLRCPKPAIDAFINLNFRKLNILSAPLYQIYVQKISD
ncbi:MAG TPA: class I SAM-dependent methyltransferase [Usitatibacteraceae bacterium]|nr:class I SAM-dependent methyltransferase [Usitatibacteraceae bacterium]